MEVTQEDPELKQLRKMIISGWPETKADLAHNICAYLNFRYELSMSNGIVYKGNWIVIPTSMQRHAQENPQIPSWKGSKQAKSKRRHILARDEWPN